MQNNKIISQRIIIHGLVQGVGFRPFVFRLAKKHNVTGYVENTSESVIIRIEGNAESLYHFVTSLKKETPVVSNIESIDITETEIEHFRNFKIIKSVDDTDKVTEISPDIAVCNDCLDDLKKQNRRIDYPFINCTNCGPRFTIIQNLPYDRERTTMQDFKMCDECLHEYEDVSDRRFHAQPTACLNCGPSYTLLLNDKIIVDFSEIIPSVTNLLEAGKIIAFKGLGGFHLACDALNEDAVKQLRSSKHREGKPFAVMFKNINILKEYVFITEEEENLLATWRRPIVILKQKKELAFSVSNGFLTIGAMLPYLPVHYLLFEKLSLPAIVLTSGNISDEPIIIENEKALRKLKIITNTFLLNNRDIYNRTDDSVCSVINDKPRFIRRSRGYVPQPVKVNLNTEGIFAAGAELVNCFAIGKGKQVILSQHIGDLKNFETYEFYRESFSRFKKLFRFNPVFSACDKHPDYFSTRFTKELNIPVIEVQHHHAHIASVMAEYQLDEPVIGVAFDGTGLGDDNTIWGSEFLICNLENYQRKAHLSYIPLPGGDAVSKETWRTGLSVLFQLYGNDLFNLDIPFIKYINKDKALLLLKAIQQGLNTPLSCSAGRWFDGVSAIINCCPEALFHSEAPMRLENLTKPGISDHYSFSIGNTINMTGIIHQIVDDILKNIDISDISTKFHNTIISVIFAGTEKLRTETGINKVVLSGGTFQNKYLSERIEQKLDESGFNVFTPQIMPANDGGIASGQLIIAAKMRDLGNY